MREKGVEQNGTEDPKGMGGWMGRPFFYFWREVHAAAHSRCGTKGVRLGRPTVT